MLKTSKNSFVASLLLILVISGSGFQVQAVPKPNNSTKPVRKQTNSIKPVSKPKNPPKVVPVVPPPPIKANPVFQSVVPQLRKVTQIRLLLPQEIPAVQQEPQLYATIEAVTAQKYQIILGFIPDCNGGTACRYGEVTGEAVTNNTPIMTGKAIFLRQGVTAYFSPSRCGANCSDAVVMWRQNGIQYSVGIKAAQQGDVVKMANSLIVP